MTATPQALRASSPYAGEPLGDENPSDCLTAATSPFRGGFGGDATSAAGPQDEIKQGSPGRLRPGAKGEMEIGKHYIH